VPPRPSSSANSADCQQASKLRDQAALYRGTGRVLRARLFEERAHALCSALPTPAPEGEPQRAREQLEDVWSWLARTGPRQALGPDRLSDSRIAASLDEAALGLSRDKKHELIVEPVFADFDRAGTPMTGWLRTSDTGFGKVGEWFERFVVPKLDDVVRTKPIGPFADRIVVYTRQGYGQAQVAVVFDVVEGRKVDQVTLPSEQADLGPLRLDDAHFAVPVVYTTSGCSAEQADTCGAMRESVDIWQAWPPRRIARFNAPTAKDLNHGERVVTMQLPNQGHGPPKENCKKGCPYGGYAPTRIPSERLRASDATDRNASPQLQKLIDLGHGMLAVDWNGKMSLIDWISQSVLGVFPHVSSAVGGVTASPSGRFVAYRADNEALGLYDRKTGSNRVLLAPAFGFNGSAVFSPDEHWLAAGGGWGFGYLWNTLTGRLERTLPSPVPFVRVVEDEGILDAVGFIGAGKEVVLSASLGGTLQRYEIPSGRHLPWPASRKECLDVLGPTQMAERSDGTVAFLGSNGRQFEMGPSGVTAVSDCGRELVTIEAIAKDGEVFLQRLNREASAGQPSSLMQSVSSRDGKILGQWGADGLLEPFEISQDGRYWIGNAGPVISLNDSNELWPRRGINRWWAGPTVTDTVIQFASGATLDVARAELSLRVPSAQHETTAPVSQQRQDELRRIETQERVEVGAYAAQNDHGKVTFYKGAHELASHPGYARGLALREDGSELLLMMEDGLHLWQPQTGKERLLQIEELSGYRVTWAAFGPLGTLLLLGTAWPPNYTDQSETIVLMAVDEASEKVLFRKGLGAAIRKPSFGTSSSRQVLRALLGDDLVAWDIKTGAEVERWKQVTAYETVAHRTLLAFLGTGRAELARVFPPERLATVQMLGNRPNALVTSPDGRFELLGDRQETAIHLRCRINHVVLPFSACTERSEWPGLLKERLGAAVASATQ
jgi:hypothetical protein